MGILDKWRETAMAANPNLKVRQEEPNANAVPKPSLVAGALNAAFPRATAVLGGADEIKRRADIYDNGVPMAPPKPPVTTSTLPPETASSQQSASQFPARPDPTILSPTPGISVQTTPIGRAGALERRDYTVPSGTAAGVVPAGSSRGGFVGAATDAEAARNLQARAAQDEAAGAIAASTDRSIEAMRDLRAEQMGITRNALDTAEGRAKGTSVLPSAPSPFSLSGDSRGDEVFRQNRLESTINDPRASRSERAAALDMYNSYLARPTASSPQVPTTNSADLQRYLLDQQKFGWQQKVDKSNLGLRQIELGTKAAAQTAPSNKEIAKERAAFLQNFIYPDENAPQAELGALTWQLSQTTDGVVPPELMLDYINKAAEANGVDWKNAPPKSLTELGKKAMELAKADY